MACKPLVPAHENLGAEQFIIMSSIDLLFKRRNNLVDT